MVTVRKSVVIKFVGGWGNLGFIRRVGCYISKTTGGEKYKFIPKNGLCSIHLLIGMVQAIFDWKLLHLSGDGVSTQRLALTLKAVAGRRPSR